MERLFRVSERAPMAQAPMLATAAAGAQQLNALQVAARTRFQRAMGEVRFDEARWAEQSGVSTPADLVGLLLPLKPANTFDNAQDRIATIRQITLDPVYQLK
jgi:hypothetical protein